MTQRFDHSVHAQLREIDIIDDMLTPNEGLWYEETHCRQQEHYGRTNRRCDILPASRLCPLEDPREPRRASRERTVRPVIDVRFRP